MNRCHLKLSSLIVLGSIACTAASGAVSGTAPASTQGAKSYSTTDLDQDEAGHSAELDAQLEQARERLDEAAREVAELSARLSKPLVDRFMSFGEGPGRAVIGVQLDPHSTKDGARITEVSPGGPAAEAGLRVGDVITVINGKDVKGDQSARDVVHFMRDVAPDSKVKVRVLRDGKPQEFVVTARPGMTFFAMHGMGPDLHDFPEAPPGEFFGPSFMIHGPISDMELASLTPQLGRYFGTEKGVLVVRAPKDGEFKLEDGDVILSIDGREPTTGSHATRILGSYQPGEKISMKLMRQHKAVTVESTIPDRPAVPVPPLPPIPPGAPGPAHQHRMHLPPGDEAPT